MRPRSETEVPKIHRWVFCFAVTPEIILSEVYSVVFGTTFDCTSPVLLAVLVNGFDVSI